MRDHYYIFADGGKLKEITAAEAERIQAENESLIATTGNLQEVMSAWEKVRFVIQL